MLTAAQLRSHPDVYVENKNSRGNFHLVLSEQVLLVFPVGTWSMSCAKRYIEIVTRLIDNKNLQQFGGIVCLDRWELATPEVLHELSEFNQRTHQRGLVCESLLGANQLDVKLTIVDNSVVKAPLQVEKVASIDEALDHMQKHSLSFDKELLTSAYQRRNAL